MIADSHTHIFWPEVVADRERFFNGEPAFRLLYDNPKAKLVSADALLTSMDRSDVSKSVTFGFPWQSPDLCRQGNDYVLEQAQKAPDRLISFSTLPCSSLDDAHRELERSARAKTDGFGELSFYCAKESETINQWRYEIGEAAAALNLPTLWHVTEQVGHDYPGKGGMTPKEAAILIHRLCGAVIILAHWGGGLPFYELMPELKKACQNVYYDTAASPYLYDKKIFQIAASIVGSDRILFGSDYPLLSQKRYIDQIRSAELDEKTEANLLGNNLLRLVGKEPA